MNPSWMHHGGLVIVGRGGGFRVRIFRGSTGNDFNPKIQRTIAGFVYTQLASPQNMISNFVVRTAHEGRTQGTALPMPQDVRKFWVEMMHEGEEEAGCD